jgi:hypothetical protein
MRVVNFGLCTPARSCRPASLVRPDLTACARDEERNGVARIMRQLVRCRCGARTQGASERALIVPRPRVAFSHDGVLAGFSCSLQPAVQARSLSLGNGNSRVADDEGHEDVYIYTTCSRSWFLVLGRPSRIGDRVSLKPYVRASGGVSILNRHCCMVVLASHAYIFSHRD